jgi:hypothetical protein
MPSSSTNYSYDIPTVGSDSTTYGTIVNQFVESLSAKLKAVSDKINTAGVGASSTLAQVNRNIAQVNAINSRIPVGVADLLPDPYSGATTPVSTWPYLNTELQAQGFSPPTTAQEVLDFDYSGFATYLNTRFNSLSARIVGLDAPITIADSSTLVCETNAILNTIGEFKNVTTTTQTNSVSVETIKTIPLLYGTGNFQGVIFWPYVLGSGSGAGPFDTIIKELFYPSSTVPSSFNSYPSSSITSNGFNNSDKQTKEIGIGDIYARVENGENLDSGIYLHDTGLPSGTVNVTFLYNWGVRADKDKAYFRSGDNALSSLPNIDLDFQWIFVRVTNTTTTTDTTTSVKKTIDDVDFSGCR